MEIKKAIEWLKAISATQSNSLNKNSIADRKEALHLAIVSLEKQIPKKPIMKPFYEDMEEEYLCCPNCGNILTDRIPMDNSKFYFYCLNCGQKFDWSEDNG